MPCKICSSWDADKKECRHNPPAAYFDLAGKQTQAFPRTGPDDWCQTGFRPVLEKSKTVSFPEARKLEQPEHDGPKPENLPEFDKIELPADETPAPKRRVPTVIPSGKK